MISFRKSDSYRPLEIDERFDLLLGMYIGSTLDVNFGLLSVEVDAKREMQLVGLHHELQYTTRKRLKDSVYNSKF